MRVCQFCGTQKNVTSLGVAFRYAKFWFRDRIYLLPVCSKCRKERSHREGWISISRRNKPKLRVWFFKKKKK